MNSNSEFQEVKKDSHLTKKGDKLASLESRFIVSIILGTIISLAFLAYKIFYQKTLCLDGPMRNLLCSRGASTVTFSHMLLNFFEVLLTGVFSSFIILVLLRRNRYNPKGVD